MITPVVVFLAILTPFVSLRKPFRTPNSTMDDALVIDLGYQLNKGQTAMVWIFPRLMHFFLL